MIRGPQLVATSLAAILVAACVSPRDTMLPAGGAPSGGTGGSTTPVGRTGGTATTGVDASFPPPGVDASSSRDSSASVPPADTAPTHALDVAVQGSGSGVVVSAPGTINCPGVCSDMVPAGTLVTLQARATAPAVFTGWEGACTGTGPCSVTVNKATSVQAWFEAPGSVVWTQPIPSAGDLAVHGDSLFVTIFFRGTAMVADRMVTSAGDSDTGLAAFGTDGTLRWLKVVASPTYETFYSMLVTDSAILVGGVLGRGADLGGGNIFNPPVGMDSPDVTVKFTLTGDLVWSALTSGLDFILPIGSRYLVTGGYGAQYVSDSGQVDASFTRLPGQVDSGALLPGGGFVAAGEFFDSTTAGGNTVTSLGNSDAYVAAYSASGAERWVRIMAGLGFENTSHGIGVDGNGDVYVAGTFDQDITIGSTAYQSMGAEDIFVVKLSGASGTPLWSRQFGGGGSQKAHYLILDGDTILVAGSTSGTANFGTGSLPGYGCLARLSTATGEPIWAVGQRAGVDAVKVGPGAIYVGGGALARLRP